MPWTKGSELEFRELSVLADPGDILGTQLVCGKVTSAPKWGVHMTVGVQLTFS